MKKIEIPENKIFEIAKIIKIYLPETKTQLCFYNSKIVLYLPRKVDYLKVEELKTLLKFKYPDYQIVFYFNN